MGKPRLSLQIADRNVALTTAWASGLSYSELAAKFGISRQRTQQIVEPPRDTYVALRIRAEWRCEDCRRWTSVGHAHHLLRSVQEPNALPNLCYLCTGCHRLRHAPRRDAVDCESVAVVTAKDPAAVARIARMGGEARAKSADYRKMGSMGGKARKKKLTALERTESARKAGKASAKARAKKKAQKAT